MKIVTRFLASLFLILSIFIILSWFSISVESEIGKISEYHDKMSIPAISILEQISTNSEMMHRSIHGYALGHEHARIDYEQSKQKILELIVEYEKLALKENSSGDILASLMMQKQMVDYSQSMLQTISEYDVIAKKLFQYVENESLSDIKKEFQKLDVKKEVFSNIVLNDKNMELKGAQLEQEKLAIFLENKHVILLTIISIGTMSVIIISIYNTIWFKNRIRRIQNNLEIIGTGKFENVSIPKKEQNELFEIEKQTKNIAMKLEEYKNQILAEEKINSIGKLAANMAHDLRNPLTVITNSIDIIEKSKDQKLHEQEIPRIKRAIERMAHQINDVLNYVQPQQLTKEKTSIQKICNLAIDSLQIPDNVAIIVSEKETYVWVDREKLEIVFVNLIHNSIMTIGEKNTGKISIEISEKKDETLISVTDSGDLSDEDLGKMFIPLYTTKMTGVGLGLSSCKKIIEEHGGKIWAKNKPTRIFFTIPCMK